MPKMFWSETMLDNGIVHFLNYPLLRSEPGKKILMAAPIRKDLWLFLLPGGSSAPRYFLG
jgi:hypothetical protein